MPGSGRSPGGENGNPLQYSCWENPVDRAAWWATVYGVAKTWLSTHTYTELGVRGCGWQVVWGKSLSLPRLQLSLYKRKVLKESVSRSVVLTLCDPMDCSPPGSSVHGILQARILEWVAIPFRRWSPNPGIEPGSPTLKADSLPSEPPGKPPLQEKIKKLSSGSEFCASGILVI